MPMPVEMQETEIPGVLVVKAGRVSDDRGYFSELYSKQVWAEAGFADEFVQDNLSKSVRGVLRGLHYQLSAHGMGKLVRAITGSVFDVAVDLRKGSPTFGQWTAATLSAENGLALWVPVGFAHGFLTLEDDTHVLYKCTAHHAPDFERAVRYNDPEIAIDWPFEPLHISGKDAAAPLLKDAEHDFAYAQ